MYSKLTTHQGAQDIGDEEKRVRESDGREVNNSVNKDDHDHNHDDNHDGDINKYDKADDNDKDDNEDNAYMFEYLTV